MQKENENFFKKNEIYIFESLILFYYLLMNKDKGI